MWTKKQRYAWILENLDKLPGSGIIYCLTRRECEELADFLNINGLNVMTLGAMLTLPESDKLTELLSNIDFNGISIDNFDMLILDDLNLYGSIRNGDVQGYLISQEAFYPLEFRMKAEWGSYENQVMPAIWSFEHLAFVPLSELMGKTDMDNVMKVIGSVMPSMSNNTLTSVQMFSRIMQMLPLNSAEWGL